MPDDALTGTTDTVKPWTIKSISTQARDQAIAAARLEDLTVGQWLERRINEWTNTAPGAVATVARPLGADIAEMARLAIALSEVAPAHSNAPVLRTARLTVRAALLSLRPRRNVEAAAKRPDRVDQARIVGGSAGEPPKGEAFAADAAE